MQKPTIGRVVHFFPAASDALYRNGEPLAATIVKVWSDTCVNLAAFDGNANLHQPTSVLLHQDGNERPSAGFAAWPAREGVQLEVKLDATSGATPLPPMSDAALELQIREAGADVAPRVTPEQIDALSNGLVIHTHHFPGTTTTVAVATLPDGFVVSTGFSACISAKNFDADIGARFASGNALTAARSKLWELEGYLLRAALLGSEAYIGSGTAVEESSC